MIKFTLINITFDFLNRPGVDSGGCEQEAAQTAVGVASTFAFWVALWEGLDDLHKGFWENTRLVVHRALKRDRRREERISGEGLGKRRGADRFKRREIKERSSSRDEFSWLIILFITCRWCYELSMRPFYYTPGVYASIHSHTFTAEPGNEEAFWRGSSHCNSLEYVI